MVERVDPARLGFGVLVDEQVHRRLSRATWSRSAYMSRNFQVVSTWSSGKGGGAGKKALRRQVQHHRAVLADRIEHHRTLGLGDDLAQDVDALRLELLEMGQAAREELDWRVHDARAFGN